MKKRPSRYKGSKISLCKDKPLMLVPIEVAHILSDATKDYLMKEVDH